MIIDGDCGSEGSILDSVARINCHDPAYWTGSLAKLHRA